MPTKTWKSFERIVASFFDTRRTPLSGENSGHNTNSDTLHPDLYIECKYRARSSLGTLFNDVKEKGKKEGKVPIICTKDKRSNGFLITVHCDDLKEFVKHVNLDNIAEDED